MVLQTASARWKLEKRFKAPRKTLRAIEQYMAVAADYIQHPDGMFLPPAVTPPSAAPPVPGSPGLPPGGGPPMLPPMGGPPGAEMAPPAPPPVQVAPAMSGPPALPT